MKVETFVNGLGVQFYTGVPDSQLKSLCDYLMDHKGIGKQHIIAANEGNCTALAAGYHLATGKVPAVYLQNSGIGNIINPVASLLNDKVYAIPCIFIVGWRGEPGIKDEPQHIFQGEVTVQLLEDMDITTCVIDRETDEQQLSAKMQEFSAILENGKSVAFIIKKGALSYDNKVKYVNEYSLKREQIIEKIVAVSKDDIIVSTTGKASRELFEIRERNGQTHERDFLTVGSMGHSSSIALEIALSKPDRKVWCIDGDGAVLMHMGAMAVIGTNKPKNMIHIVINNEAHETVGGMPTVADSIDLTQIALGCGYCKAVSVSDAEDLESELQKACMGNELTLIEVKCGIGARDDLGRPTVSARENKDNFMKFLQQNTF